LGFAVAFEDEVIGVEPFGEVGTGEGHGFAVVEKNIFMDKGRVGIYFKPSTGDYEPELYGVVLQGNIVGDNGELQPVVVETAILFEREGVWGSHVGNGANGI
jgi:hypothetical protein